MGFKKLINGEALLNTFKNIQRVKNSTKRYRFLPHLYLLGNNLLMAQSTGSTTLGTGIYY